jgi:hypothetical protein
VDKNTLNEAVKACKEETKFALEIVYNLLNHGQQKQLLKNEAVVELFDRYGVEY